MTAHKISPGIKATVRTATVKSLLFAFLPFGVMALSIFAGPLGTPADSFASDFYSMFFAVIGPLGFLPMLIAIGLMKASGIANIKHGLVEITADYAVKYQRVGNICLCLLVVTLVAMIWAIVRYSFYVTPNRLVVHDGLFALSHQYTWDDVADIHETCGVRGNGHGNGSWINYSFTLTLKDDQAIDIVNNKQVKAMAAFIERFLKARADLSPALFSYENEEPDYCPATFSTTLPRDQEMVGL